jgi:hypothetical protein
MDPARRVSVTTGDVSQLSPGWAATDLGRALITAAETIEDDEVNDGPQVAAARQIVLLSDLQQGGNLDALLGYEWPERTEVAIRPIPCRGTTNASLRLVTNSDALAARRSDDRAKIRVTNSADADKDRFQLHWEGDDAPGRVVDVYVPPGHSVVVRAPTEPNQSTPTRRHASRLVLTGDDQDFDNVLYLAAPSQRQIGILYLGRDDPNDTRQMLYYLRRAFEVEGALTSHVTCRAGDELIRGNDVAVAQMIVVADRLSQPNVELLRRHMESGGVLLLVLTSAESAAALSGLTGIEGLAAPEADVGRYAMLGRIDFDHPLLKPFSDPRFGDFTRIHFWKYRRIELTNCPGARVLAWFDSEDPAWFEIPVERGSLLVWTSGWHPSDSDLALSSKFVPLLYSILESGGQIMGRPSQYFVSGPVPLSDRAGSEVKDLQIRRPDDSVVRLAEDQETFTQTDMPGLYTISSSGREVNPQFFAVNLSAEESQTDPMPIEDIERRGVVLERPTGRPTDVAAANPQSVIPNPQSKEEFWRWVLAAAFGMLLMETWLAGRPSLRTEASRDEQPAFKEEQP